MEQHNPNNPAAWHGLQVIDGGSSRDGLVRLLAALPTSHTCDEHPPHQRAVIVAPSSLSELGSRPARYGLRSIKLHTYYWPHFSGEDLPTDWSIGALLPSESSSFALNVYVADLL